MIYFYLEILLILIYITLAVLEKDFLTVPIILLLGAQIIILKIKTNKQNLEIKNLNLVCDKSRSFKHDFNNIMLAIGGYIKTNNIDDLKNYYNTIMPEVSHVNSICHSHSKLIENPAIYNIISNKYDLAEKLNVKMSLNVSSNINEINLNSYHLTKILGILLDNAIESASNCQNKVVNISFFKENEKQIILIENTYLNKDISINKIFCKDFSSKENHSGFGLWEVNKIISKHKNIRLYTKAEKNFFTQELEIS